MFYDLNNAIKYSNILNLMADVICLILSKSLLNFLNFSKGRFQFSCCDQIWALADEAAIGMFRVFC